MIEARAGIQPPADAGGPGPRVIVSVITVAALAGLGIGLGLHLLLAKPAPTAAAIPGSAVTRTAGLRGQATWAPGARPAPSITTLRDQTGRLFSLSSLRGRTVAITFFDSRCTQACPLEGRALASAELSLPAAQRPVLVVVSVNPLDTAASARSAARKWGLAGAGQWHWLMGRPAKLARIWSAYHTLVKPTTGDIIHTEALYLVDRRGDERSGYLYPFVPKFVASDLRMLASPRGGHV